jgi:hypothetical protein
LLDLRGESGEQRDSRKRRRVAKAVEEPAERRGGGHRRCRCGERRASRIEGETFDLVAGFYKNAIGHVQSHGALVTSCDSDDIFLKNLSKECLREFF